MKLEIYRDNSKNGFRWRAIDTNGRIIADSAEAYVNENNAVRAVRNVIGEFKTLTGYFTPDGTHAFIDPSNKNEDS